MLQEVMFVEETTNARKGLAFSILTIIILVLAITALVVLFFMSRSNFSESIANEISSIFSRLSLP